MKSQALSHGVPVIPNYSFDQSIATVIDLVDGTGRPTRAAEVTLVPAGRRGQTTGEMTKGRDA